MGGDKKKEKTQEKLKEIFDATIDNGIRYDGSFNEINYFNLISKAAADNSLYEINKNNVCMFKCDYDDKDSIMLLFSIPMTQEKGKHISERVMEVIKQTEECFTTLDFVNSKEVKDDRFVYITMIKEITRNGDD